MSEIIINGKITVDGKCSISRERTNDKPAMIVNYGAFQCAEYFPDIKEIEFSGKKAVGVDVFRESFGSEDSEYVYEFRAAKIEGMD